MRSIFGTSCLTASLMFTLGCSPSGGEQDPDACAAGEYNAPEGSGDCLPCPEGTWREADGSLSSIDSCTERACPADTRVLRQACWSCPAGTTNEAGDDRAGPDTECDAEVCAEDERVASNACVACPEGETNAAGDLATGEDTQCDGAVCPGDQRVSGGECVACAPGSTNAAGDDPAGPDTGCDVEVCAEDERVSSNACVACAPGTGRPAGDLATGEDTLCEGVTCEEMEYVRDQACVACPQGLYNTAGDLARGEDTLCDVDWCEHQGGRACVTSMLKATNAATASQYFGASVDAQGDHAVVGSRGDASCSSHFFGDVDDTGCGGAGAAWVYTRAEVFGQTNWGGDAYLKSLSPDAMDAFGASVAVYGDVVAVGAPGEGGCEAGVHSALGALPGGGEGGDGGFGPPNPWDDDGCADSGAVWVFARDPDTNRWEAEAYIKPEQVSEADAFGAQVAFYGDRLVVGTYYEDGCGAGVGAAPDDGCTDTGAAHVYRRVAGPEPSWVLEAYIKPEVPLDGGLFGRAVAIHGGVIAVARTGTARGSVSIYRGSPLPGGAMEWAFEQVVASTLTPPESSDGFAYDVALEQDVLVVGEQGGDGVHVFTRDGATWGLEVVIEQLAGEDSDGFGQAVAISGDRVVVGAHGEDSCGGVGDTADDGCDGSGAAYLYARGDSGEWALERVLKASAPRASDRYGRAVAVSGADVIVGAPRQASCSRLGGVGDDGCPLSGAAFGHQLEPTILPPQ